MFVESFTQISPSSSSLAATIHLTGQWGKLAKAMFWLWGRESCGWGIKKRGHHLRTLGECEDLNYRWYMCKNFQHHITKPSPHSQNRTSSRSSHFSWQKAMAMSSKFTSSHNGDSTAHDEIHSKYYKSVITPRSTPIYPLHSSHQIKYSSSHERHCVLIFLLMFFFPQQLRQLSRQKIPELPTSPVCHTASYKYRECQKHRLERDGGH